MTRHRVMAIGLDGLDVTLAERFMAEGQMPALASLRERSARFVLDEGHARHAGLPWEHVTSGLSPETARRWGQVEFDPTSYTAWQDGAYFAPWWAETDLRVVVFDTPFVDLRLAPNTQGIVAWGAHNPGTVTAARPAALRTEFTKRFGEYPGNEWTYGTPWPSSVRSRLMGEALCQGLDVRTRAARWLAAERFPQWDFFFAVTSELHNGAEGLWHGVDPGHPLNTHPSACAAAAAMLDIHRALDCMIGQLIEAAGDAVIVAFNMGGMGPNQCDVQSMVLLPELLYRHAFGQPLLTLPSSWTENPDRLPMLEEHENWDTARLSWIPEPSNGQPGISAGGGLHGVARHLPKSVKGLLKGVRSAAAGWRSRHSPARLGLYYMPAYNYRNHWPRMPAFAFPSFLDGRVRINLRGREKHGIVELSQYEGTCLTLETLLRECRDPRTGEPTVGTIERASTPNPLDLKGSESDLLVVWRNVAAALEHPRLGLVGPVPLRRTGGHTRQGIAYLAAPGLEPGDRGVRPSCDIVPTIVRLLGVNPTTPLVGNDLLSA